MVPRFLLLLLALVALCSAQSSPSTRSRPRWMAGARINEWIKINGTAGAGGAAINAYSGWAINELTNDIWIALAGGHDDSSDNRVVSLRLSDDAPTWTLRLAPSPNVTRDTDYYSDGRPSSRHLYHTLHFVPQVNRLLAVGCRFSYGAAYTFGHVDAFNPDNNTWDPHNTYPDALPGHYGAVRILSTGDVWTAALSRWQPSTNRWTQPITTRTNAFVRWPIAHDSKRNQLFTLNWADGEGYREPIMHATRIPVNGSVQYDITFNPSAAIDQFAIDKPTYSGMDYDAANDRFLFYHGQNENSATGPGRIYVITPTNTSTGWEMSILQLASGSAIPPPSSGVHNRWRYVPDLGGFVVMPMSADGIWFIATGDPSTVPPVSAVPISPAPYVPKAPASNGNVPSNGQVGTTPGSVPKAKAPGAAGTAAAAVSSIVAFLFAVMLCLSFQ